MPRWLFLCGCLERPCKTPVVWTYIQHVTQWSVVILHNSKSSLLKLLWLLQTVCSCENPLRVDQSSPTEMDSRAVKKIMQLKWNVHNTCTINPSNYNLYKPFSVMLVLTSSGGWFARATNEVSICSLPRYDQNSALVWWPASHTLVQLK